MHHDTGLVVTIAAGLVLAFAFGFLASRVKLPPLVGYLIAGIVVGPFTPGFVADAGLASQLAEIGVILLMFGVGLHFSTDDLLAVRGVAGPGAVLQIVFVTALGVGVAYLWGWSFGAGVIFGLSLSVASTVVLLRALDEGNAIESANGRIAVGWLIIEDLAMVLALVLVPALAGALGTSGSDSSAGPPSTAGAALAVLLTLGQVSAFVLIMLLLGPRVLPPLLRQVARAGSRELFTLAVLALALGIAVGSATLFGVSLALGAFCAGVVLAKSEYSQRAATESLPLQDAFAVLFFVSVGMLFDPSILVREPLAVLVTLLIIVVGKTLITYAIVTALGYPAHTALTVSASLAQIGEFSFILAGLGLGLGLLPEEGRDLILAGAILSIILNPAVFSLVEPLAAWIDSRSDTRSAHRRSALKLARLVERLAIRQREVEAHAPPRATLSDDTLAKFPMFLRCSPAGRSELASLFKPRSVVPGERVIRRGDAPEEMFFISSGAMEVALPDEKVTLGPGDFFGEMGVLSGEARSADVTAVDFTDLLTLSREDFLRFVANHPELGAEVGAVADERAAMNQRAERRPAGAQKAGDARQEEQRNHFTEPGKSA
jgi:CPA2 family monovalent cation:H+ antiporter-2